jgi:hypothetical protein
MSHGLKETLLFGSSLFTSPFLKRKSCPLPRLRGWTAVTVVNANPPCPILEEDRYGLAVHGRHTGHWQPLFDARPQCRVISWIFNRHRELLPRS